MPAYKKVSIYINIAQKMKFPINDFFSKCDQICSFLPIWLHLPKKSLIENFIFCAVLFSQCFGNSHSCVQIKSNDYCDGVSEKLKHLKSYDNFFNPVLLLITLEISHFVSRESPTSKEARVDILKSLGSSVCYWHMVQQSPIFVAASINNLRFFVWVFSLWSWINILAWSIRSWTIVITSMDVLIYF